MEIWVKYFKFVVIWTIITTAIIWMATIIVGNFNGETITIHWKSFVLILLISNALLNIYLVNEMRN